MIISAVTLLVTVLLLIKMNGRNKEVQMLTAQMEHFLLHPENPLEENLQEGELAVLLNQVSRLEQALCLAQKRQLVREEELAHFVENLAHQMMNTITALQLQLELARMNRTEHHVDKSLECLIRMEGEVAHILQSGQLAVGKIHMEFEPIDFSAVLNDCVDMVCAISENKDVHIHVSTPKELIVQGDSFWLAQAVENVLKNAVEHSHAGGEVCVYLKDEGRNLVLRIEDCGDGISEEELPLLFVRFHRGTHVNSGYGIGLSMARDIMIANHGGISAGNRQGCGAWFELRLPLLEGSRPYS